MKMLFLAIAVLLPLAQTPPASPRAETASIRGRITDKVSGEPIARAVVRVSPADGRSRGTATISDADGRYAFPMLVPGRYFIRAEPPPFGARYVGTAYTGTASPSMIMTLKSGEETRSRSTSRSNGRTRSPAALSTWTARRPRGCASWRDQSVRTAAGEDPTGRRTILAGSGSSGCCPVATRSVPNSSRRNRCRSNRSSSSP